MSRTRFPAFTLVEILIVVVILGILAAIATPQFAAATQDATRTATLDQLVKVRRAMAYYYYANGSRYPQVTAGDGTWGELISASSPYMRTPPVNNWVSANGRVIALSASADTAYQSAHGWIYDPATGNIFAGSFDSSDNPFPRP